MNVKSRRKHTRIKQHVSRFIIGAKKEITVNHIMQNTSIVHREDCVVEELGINENFNPATTDTSNANAA